MHTHYLRKREVARARKLGLPDLLRLTTAGYEIAVFFLSRNSWGLRASHLTVAISLSGIRLSTSSYGMEAWFGWANGRQGCSVIPSEIGGGTEDWSNSRFGWANGRQGRWDGRFGIRLDRNARSCKSFISSPSVYKLRYIPINYQIGREIWQEQRGEDLVEIQ